MSKLSVKRVTRKLTTSEEKRLVAAREHVRTELPEMNSRDQMRKDASNETTLSGELRRAIHASQLPVAEIAGRVGIGPILLDDFLTGERTLRSDVMDRLAEVLGYTLRSAG